MDKIKLTVNDIARINGIINEINTEKLRISKSDNGSVNYDKLTDLMISLFRTFFGLGVNDGIFAAILNDATIRYGLERLIFLNLKFLQLKDEGTGYWISDEDNRRLLSISICGNSIYLDNKNIELLFSENKLTILYKSIGQISKVLMVFDSDGLVMRRETKKQLFPMRVNDMKGYGCIDTVSIERSMDNPCLVNIVDTLKITDNDSVSMMTSKAFSGYLQPMNLFDLSSVFKLEDECRENLIDGNSCFRSGGIIDKNFPNIKKAFITRMKKCKGFSRKRKNNV